jgi:hypothetical protein
MKGKFMGEVRERLLLAERQSTTLLDCQTSLARTSDGRGMKSSLEG